MKKLNTPVIKRQILYDSTYMRYLEYSNSQTQKENDSCQGLAGEGGGEDEMGNLVFIGQFQFGKIKKIF